MEQVMISWTGDQGRPVNELVSCVARMRTGFNCSCYTTDK